MILAIIQARCGSSRLPNKALSAIDEKPVIAHVLERALAIRQVDQVVLALPGGDGEHTLWQWALQTLQHAVGRSFAVRRVHEVAPSDVLGRFRVVADAYQPTAIVRLTGDCPLLAPELADLVIATYLSEPPVVHYASNVAPGYVDGTDVEVFSREALYRADREATTAHDREHVTPWIRYHLRSVAVTRPFTGTKGRLDSVAAIGKVSIDTAEDLEHVRRIARRLKPGDFSLRATLAAAVYTPEATR